MPRDGAARTAAELLSVEGITLARLRAVWGTGHIPGQLHQQLEADCRYASMRRQRVDIDALKRDEAMKIPAIWIFGCWRLSAEA